MSKLINKGQLSWLVSREDSGDVAWVLKAQLPDSEEFTLARGTSKNLRLANSALAAEAVAFICKSRASK